MSKLIWTLVCVGLAIWMMSRPIPQITMEEYREGCIQWEHGTGGSPQDCAEYDQMQRRSELLVNDRWKCEQEGPSSSACSFVRDNEITSKPAYDKTTRYLMPSIVMFVVWFVPMLLIIIWRAVGGGRKKKIGANNIP